MPLDSGLLPEDTLELGKKNCALLKPGIYIIFFLVLESET